MDYTSFPDLLAVDGGGSGCRVALIVGGQRFDAQGGPTNLYETPDVGIDTLRTTLLRAASQAGIGPYDLANLPAHLGLAGVVTAEQSTYVARSLSLTNASIEDDRQSVVTGVLGSEDGTVAALGTGSFFARVTDGKMRSIGGWGHRFRDEASGTWIGKALIKKTLDGVDGLCDETEMTRRFVENSGGPLALLRTYHGASPAKIAALAPNVFAAAEAEDPHAVAILTQAVKDSLAAFSVLGWTPQDPATFTGSVGLRLAPIFAKATRANMKAPKGNALDGAILLAARRATA